MRALLGVGVGVAVAWALAACPEPGQYEGPIAVNPNAKQLLLVPGKARASSAEKPAPAPSGHVARVHAMKAGEELSGPRALGRAGDLVLENDEVVFVIQAAGPGVGIAESGGNLLDAADARTRKDELGLFMTWFGPPARQAVYDAVESGVDANGTAWVLARGRELVDDGLAVTTRYALAPPDRALLVTTTVHNAKDEPTTLSFGDAVAWGDAVHVAPGLEAGFEGPSSGSYVGGIGRFTSYALTSTEMAIAATTFDGWTRTTQRKDVLLAPGASESYARVLVVGERGDLASVVAELTHASGGALGAVELSLVDEAQRPLPAPPGAKVVLSAPGGGDVLSLRAEGGGRPFGGEVPPGDYVARWVEGVEGDGRAGGAPVQVKVTANAVSRATLAVGPSSRLSIDCGGPCEASVVRRGGAGGGWRKVVEAGTGKAEVPVVPGRYEVTLSRGIACRPVVLDVDAVAGSITPVVGNVSRVVDTSGYVAVRLVAGTLFAPGVLRDRLNAAAAEGAEVVVGGDANTAVDLEPDVRDLGLAATLATFPGETLTGDTSRPGPARWGYGMAFPVPFDPAKPRGGASVVRDHAPADLFAELRKAGLVIAGAVSPASPASPAAALVDAEYISVDGLPAQHATIALFLGALASGHPLTPFSGLTYVAVPDSRPPAAADIVHAVAQARDVLLTTGPFLRVEADAGGGAGIGGIARGPDVTFKVHVECRSGLCPDRLALLRAGGGAVDVPFTLAPTLAGAAAATGVARVHFAADDAVVVTASGAGGAVFAMTGAMWIDADGDGHSLGR